MKVGLRKYGGVVVPMVTPFTREGGIDEPAVERITEHLVSHGHAGVFPLGTTGESASIPYHSKRKVVDAVIKANRGRAHVYAGIASNSFKESVDVSKLYKELGASCVVAHVPSYYPLSDAEIESYFLKLADAVALPLIAYNIPVTTRHSIPLDVVDKLRKHPNIAAIKDSEGNAERLTELLKRTGGRGGWPVLIGTSVYMTLGFRSGAAGIVPSGGHLVPDLYQSMYDNAMKDNWPEVERMQRETDAACQPYLKGNTI